MRLEVAVFQLVYEVRLCTQNLGSQNRQTLSRYINFPVFVANPCHGRPVWRVLIKTFYSLHNQYVKSFRHSRRITRASFLPATPCGP